jgi:hypothetical protein
MLVCLYAYIVKAYKLCDYTSIWLYAMVKHDNGKRRTTILVDDLLWKRFLSYVVKKHGTAKKASVEVENAVKEYLDRHDKEL